MLIQDKNPRFREPAGQQGRGRDLSPRGPERPRPSEAGGPAAGAEIIDELHETDYGSRDFAARDPEGNRWSFGTYRGEPRKSS